MEVDGTAESSFYAAINKSDILNSSFTKQNSSVDNARLIYLAYVDEDSPDDEDADEEEILVQEEEEEEEFGCDKHLHLERDMRKCDAVREELKRKLVNKRNEAVRNTPYVVSTLAFTLLQKSFALEYAVNACVEKLDRKANVVSVSAEPGDKINKSIFACTVGSLIKNKLTEAQVKTIKLFLPPIYEIPKQFNAKLLLAKYIEQYYGSDGDEDLVKLKDFCLALKFQHVNDEQSLMSFYKLVNDSERCRQKPSSDTQRFIDACNFVVYTYALNFYRSNYEICRLDRELESLWVTSIDDPTEDFILFDKAKIYFVPRNGCFYAYKKETECVLKAFTMSSLFCELI